MNDISLENPRLDPSTWGLTYDKEKLLMGENPRIAANSIMPGLLSQKGYEQTVWAGTVTDMFESGQLPRRPIVKEGQTNPEYVNQFPLYSTELLELMILAGESPDGSPQELVRRVKNNSKLERKLWGTKVQRDIDDCQGKYPGSCAQQLGVLADKWDVDARHLKTYYRSRGGMMT
jgi:hypothetical protein